MINIDYLLPENKNYPPYPYGTGINTRVIPVLPVFYIIPSTRNQGEK